MYVEALTDQIERGAKEIIERLDSMGGPLAAIEKGYVQGEIQNSAYQYQRDIEEQRQIVVGVNKFQTPESDALHSFRIDPQLEGQQIERLRAVRAGRSQSQVEAALSELERAARGADNLLPRILVACRALATVGEISETLRRVFGEHREIF